MKIREAAKLSSKDALTQLSSAQCGLSSVEASRRLSAHGRNTIAEQARASIIVELFSHFKNPLVILLIVAAVISAYTGETIDAAIILIMALASVILDFVQEHKADAAARKLRDRIVMNTTVIREGE